jgi:hypothetical protein
MAERDRAAVDVDDRRIEVQLAQHRQLWAAKASFSSRPITLGSTPADAWRRCARSAQDSADQR